MPLQAGNYGVYVRHRAFVASPASINFLDRREETHHDLVIVLISLIILASILSRRGGPHRAVGIVQHNRLPCQDGAIIDLHVAVQQVEDYIPLVTEAGSRANVPAIENVGNG
jgi:hypothetical protein